MGNDFVFSFGVIVNHACKMEYVLISASQRECLLGGNWSVPLPICGGKILVVYTSYRIYVQKSTVEILEHQSTEIQWTK